MRHCESLDEVRSEIDAIDRRIVELIAQRAGYVDQVLRFKSTPADVVAPTREAQVVRNVRAAAVELGTDPDVTERVFRAMIAGFVAYELRRMEQRV